MTQFSFNSMLKDEILKKNQLKKNIKKTRAMRPE
jgi:hypothetical protein